MANGYYRPGTANDQDCQASSGGYDNSGNNAFIGNYGGTTYQYHVLFDPLDIPNGATIDSAYLYLYCDARGGTVNGEVCAEDSDDAAAYTSNPFARSQIGTSVTWNGICPTVYEWDKSPDIKTVIQAIVNRAGWVAGQAMDLIVKAPGLDSGNYVRTVQSNYGSIYALLVVEWHTATKYVKVSEVAASADDTYNNNADSTGRITEQYAQFGHDGTNSFRAFFRFNAKVHDGGDVDTIDEAHLIVASHDARTTTGWYGTIATLDDESAFASVSSSYSRATISGQTPVNWTVDNWNVEDLKVSPDIKNPVSYRVAQGDYDPDGAGDYPYIALRISEGDANAKNEFRRVTNYDRTGIGDLKPMLVIAYTIIAQYDASFAAQTKRIIQGAAGYNAQTLRIVAEQFAASFKAQTKRTLISISDFIAQTVRKKVIGAEFISQTSRVVLKAAQNVVQTIRRVIAPPWFNHCTDCVPDDTYTYIYVPEQDHRVVKMTSSKLAYISDIGTPGTGNSEFNIPITATIYDGNLYVVDRYNHRVQIFDLDNMSYVAQFGEFSYPWEATDGHLNTPCGVAIDSVNGQIFVVDTAHNRVTVWDLTDYSWIGAFGEYGGGDGQFITPMGCMVYGNYVYIADGQNHRFQWFDLDDYDFVGKFGSYGYGNDQFAQPVACCTDGTYVYISDHDNNRIVQRLISDWSYVNKVGTMGSGNDQFYLPAGIHTDGTYLWIADSGNDRIQKRRCSDLAYITKEHDFIRYIEFYAQSLRNITKSTVQSLQTLRNLSYISTFIAQTRRIVIEQYVAEFLAQTTRNIRSSISFIGQTLRNITKFGIVEYQTQRQLLKTVSNLFQTVRNVKKLSSFVGQTVRSITKLSDYVAQTRRLLQKSTSYASQSIRQVIKISDYVAQTIRNVIKHYIAEFLAQTKRISISSISYSGQTSRLIKSVILYFGQTIRSVNQIANYFGQTTRALQRIISHNAQSVRNVVVAYVEAFTAQTRRYINKIAFSNHQTLRIVTDVLEYIGQTNRIIVSFSDFFGQTKRALQNIATFDAQTMRHVIAEYMAVYFAQTQRALSKVVSISNQTLRRAVESFFFDSQTARIIKSSIEYSSQTLRKILYIVQFNGQTTRNIYVLFEAFVAQTQRIVNNLASYMPQTTRNIVEWYINSLQSLRNVVKVANYNSQTLRRVQNVVTFIGQTKRSLFDIFEHVVQTQRNVLKQIVEMPQTLRKTFKNIQFYGQTERFVLKFSDYVTQSLREVSKTFILYAQTFRRMVVGFSAWFDAQTMRRIKNYVTTINQTVRRPTRIFINYIQTSRIVQRFVVFNGQAIRTIVKQFTSLNQTYRKVLKLFIDGFQTNRGLQKLVVFLSQTNRQVVNLIDLSIQTVRSVLFRFVVSFTSVRQMSRVFEQAYQSVRKAVREAGFTSQTLREVLYVLTARFNAQTVRKLKAAAESSIQTNRVVQRFAETIGTTGRTVVNGILYFAQTMRYISIELVGVNLRKVYADNVQKLKDKGLDNLNVTLLKEKFTVYFKKRRDDLNVD